MSRTHRFGIKMVVADDDQTDPEDMTPIIEDVLNCRVGANANWLAVHDEMEIEHRATFIVTELKRDEQLEKSADTMVNILERAVAESIAQLRVDLKRRIKEME